jgi:RNA recognition motif.
VRELWLGNLPENLSDKKLKNTVEMFGDVENIEYYNKVRYHQVKFTTSLKEALLS